MSATYDTYYQTEDLFGEPYPELLEFFKDCTSTGKVLDLGCGQGRDAIALAKLGFSVTGIDQSKVGIEQMNAIGHSEHLDLTGKVGDIYSFDRFDLFDYILLDSILHFAKKEKEKEIRLVQDILSQMREGSKAIFCIQDTGEKLNILNQSINTNKELKRIVDRPFTYTFVDQESGHHSKTIYRMVVIEK